MAVLEWFKRSATLRTDQVNRLPVTWSLCKIRFCMSIPGCDANMQYAEWEKKFVKVESNSGIPKAKRFNIDDVTFKYKRSEGRRSVTFDNQYRMKHHQEEILVANLLANKIGGHVHLLKESGGSKTIDYNWNGKIWELKTISSVNAADNAIRRGIKQVLANTGGIIL